MPDVLVAGHVCLDILPDLSGHPPGQFETVFLPGRLVQAGPARLAPGGSVANTGLALRRLGIETRLVARAGADPLGEALRQSIAAQGAGLAEGIRLYPTSSTSYSIVISPPGSDRRFIHHPGANDDFTAGDVSDADLSQARLFHFGYPPLMKNMYAQNGRQLVELFRRVKSRGLTTSLDMAYPDPASPAGRADWPSLLSGLLPSVDVFAPSLDEIGFLLWGQVGLAPSPGLLHRLSGELLEMGAKIVALKLGEHGLYLRTTARGSALQSLGQVVPPDLADWTDFEAWQPCFQVEMVGATGSGDVTVAGLLAALLRGLGPLEAVTAALAVGACCVEAVDALSGLLPWDATLRRVRSGWPTRPEAGQFIRTGGS